jgi:hypothetical protein
MGLLNRLFGRPSPTAVSQPPRLGGEEPLQVVAESFYQDALWRLAGGRTAAQVRCEVRAVLEPEPLNPKDPNAIMVKIGGHCVGYLQKLDAAAYRPGLERLKRAGPVELRGFIVGGGPRRDGVGFLGVFLDHDPRDFGIPATGRIYGSDGFRTGFSEAVTSDVEDDTYDLSWHAKLPDDHAEACRQLRELLARETDAVDRHYMHAELTKRLYKCRDVDESALDAFDAACREHHTELQTTIRAALVEKFGCVPVIETYRQAAIRSQKAKDWPAMREWAESGITIYGAEAARADVVEDLHRRLAYAVAKLEASEKRTAPRAATSASTRTVQAVMETLICARCGSSFERVRTRGRKPTLCDSCRGTT